MDTVIYWKKQGQENIHGKVPLNSRWDLPLEDWDGMTSVAQPRLPCPGSQADTVKCRETCINASVKCRETMGKATRNYKIDASHKCGS